MITIWSVMQRSLSNRLIIAAALWLTLLVGGCSVALKLTYNQGPTLLYWWLDGYVDFNDEQAPRVKQQIEQWFRWNRRTQLPDYADMFARAGAQVLDPVITPQQMCGWAREARNRLLVAYEEGIPAFAELALTLTPEQIANIEKRFDKNDRKFRDEYLGPRREDRLKAQAKRVVERTELVSGSMDGSQHERIMQGLSASPNDPEAWLAERRLIQQEMLQGLRSLQGLPADAQGLARAKQLLREFAQHVEQSPREAYRQYHQRVWDYNCAFAAQIHNATTPAQRKYATGKFKRWEDDVRSLIAQGK
ncbi:MAG TPA: DUF6279 family lipoprotein [Burkholderiaceae bacterium]|nr:DUF6279 family lipoprotein [Burkholderiaceae bacterium]